MPFKIENGVLKKYIEEKGVAEVTIPDSVTSIGNDAFAGCLGLTDITIPDNVKSIGKKAFYACMNLTNINVSKKNKRFCSCDGVLYNKNMTILIQYPTAKKTAEFIIPDSVKIISNDAFEFCINLTGLTIPDSVKSIGKNAFAGCTELTEITIPDSVKSIRYGAFFNCVNLTNINVSKKNKRFCSCDSVLYNKNMAMLIQYPTAKKTAEFIIPDSVKSIGKNAFAGCTELTEITIPDSVKSIGYGAFSNCANLTNINVSKKNKRFCSCDSVLYNKNMAMLIQYPTAKKTAEFIIPDSVKSISEYAFWGCKSLTSITIPDSVTSIGDRAFFCYKSLKNIEICKDDVKVSFTLDNCYDLESENGGLHIFIVSSINRRLNCFSELKAHYQLPLALFMTFAYPQKSAYYLDYLKNNTEDAVRYLTDTENINLLYRVLEIGFVTKDNIDSLISYAVEHTQNGGSSEPQLVLTKYKSDNFGYKVADTFDKFML